MSTTELERLHARLSQIPTDQLRATIEDSRRSLQTTAYLVDDVGLQMDTRDLLAYLGELALLQFAERELQLRDAPDCTHPRVEDHVSHLYCPACHYTLYSTATTIRQGVVEVGYALGMKDEEHYHCRKEHRR